MADDEDEWRFSLEDLDDEAAERSSDGSNVAGDFLPGEQLEPGDIDLENALFVALGVAVAGLVFVAFVLALT